MEVFFHVNRIQQPYQTRLIELSSFRSSLDCYVKFVGTTLNLDGGVRVGIRNYEYLRQAYRRQWHSTAQPHDGISHRASLCPLKLVPCAAHVRCLNLIQENPTATMLAPKTAAPYGPCAGQTTTRDSIVSNTLPHRIIQNYKHWSR